MTQTNVSANHLVDIQTLPRESIVTLLKRASYWEFGSGSQATLANRVVANLFFEPSTRTRFSFEIAEKRLGLHTLHFDKTVSSMEKHESLKDTIKTLASLGAEALVIRHPEGGIITELVHQETGCAIINAGAGMDSHPTQALLDLYTIHKHFDRLEGLRVVIVGDVAHSRVARSTLSILRRFGVEVMISGPASMSANHLCAGFPSLCLEEVLPTVDVVMLLRVQAERHEKEGMFERGTYLEEHGLTMERFSKMKSDAIIMHPGPVNRGVEIEDTLVEHPRSKIFEQMKNGVFVRMAALEYALGAIMYGEIPRKEWI